jgi:beta-glucosidase
MLYAFGLRRRSYLACALLSAVAACSHPAPTGGTGGSNTGNGGTPGGIGGVTGGGTGGVSGAGGVTSGAGGQSGVGGGGGVATGTGGVTGGGGATKMACGDGALPADKKMPGYPASQHTTYNGMATSMLGRLSLADKAGQMRGTDQPPTSSPSYYNDIFRQPDNTAQSIKGFMFRDGPRGVNLDPPIFNGSSRGHSTVFPVPAARGAAFDVDLEYRIGQAMGDEMVAAKQTMLLSPTVNILRHPFWGRAQETYGEDTFLLGRLGTANVAGVQEYVPACAKHYAANNIENSRRTKNATMDEQTLREIYSRHYEMIIKDGGVACVMAAYNPVTVSSPAQPQANCTVNKHLLTDIIKGDFGFQGFTISDWWAVPGGEQATANATTAASAVNAGLDMELPMKIHYGLLESLVGSTVMQSQIDNSATRVLEQKFRFNIINPSGAPGLQAATTTYSGGSIGNNQAHIDLAQEAATKSMVLLKNSGAALPLKRTSGLRVAVLGTQEDYYATTSTSGNGINNRADDINNGTINFATGVRVGDVGSSRVDFDPAKAVGPFAGIQMATAGSTVMVTAPTAGTVPDPSTVDVYVVVVGLTPYDEGEEYNGSGDRTTLALNGKRNAGMQNMLVMQAVQAAAGKKPVIVVIEAGGVIDMSPWYDSVSAVVMAWYPGMVGGLALGKLLFGDANFSGKLPVTWANAATDYGTFDTGTGSNDDYFLGYRYFEKNAITPKFQFGYGLSYSGKFGYSNLVVPCSTVTKNSVVNVTFNVTNTGTVAGDEIAMLFVKFPNTTKRRGPKELKGFVRVPNIAPGATVPVTIPVRIADLKYWDMGTGSWQTESGTVQIMVGSSSADADLISDTLTVN